MTKHITRGICTNFMYLTFPVFVVSCDTNFSACSKVSVHNGWTYVSEPHIVYLEPEYEGGKSGRKSPASQSSLRGKLSSSKYQYCIYM